MAYGEIKVDTITFTDSGIDKSVSISGLVQNPTFSGDITVTGTISGDTLQGQTVSGVTVTGTTAAFTSGTFISLTGTTTQGTTATYTTGSFTSLTGTTTTGTTANFVSGVFTTQLSGATITGNAAAFTTVTGGTATITSGVFASGTAAAPSVSVGTTDNGIYSPGTDQVAISTNGTGRLFVDSSGNVGISASPTAKLEVSRLGAAWTGPAAIAGTTLFLHNGSATTTSSAHITLGAGNASTSQIYFADTDSNSVGVIGYDHNADFLQFTVNSSERLRITSDGKVGLGTSSPAEKLDIASDAPVLRLTDTDTALTSGETLGEIHFYSSDLDNPGVAAKIRTFGLGAIGQVGMAFDVRNTGSIFEALRIDSSGRVGVGTTSPGALLSLAASNTATANYYDSPRITVQNTSATSNNFAGIAFSTASGNDAAAIWSVIGSHTAGAATGSLVFGTTNSAGASTERARIDSSGRLGIGTTTPQAPLSISNGGANGIEIYSDYAGIGQSGITSYNRSTSQRTDLYISTDETIFLTGGSERARIDSSGRLLVGTSSAYNSAGSAIPQFQVHTNIASDSWSSVASFNWSNSNQGAGLQCLKSRGSSVGTRGILSSNDNVGALRFLGDDGASFVQAAVIVAQVDGTPGTNDMPGRLVFSTTADGASSPTERMRIDSSGRLLFGGTDTTPATNNVSGIAFGGGGSVQISQQSFTVLFLNRGGGSPTGTVVDIKTGGTTVGTISVTASATAYNTSSDYRLKENVTAVTDGIARLQQLKPNRFNFIADPAKTVDGFLAHEVQTVVPEAITGEKDAVDADGNPVYQGIDQSKIVPLVVAALQEAIAKIATLEQRLNDAGIN